MNNFYPHFSVVLLCTIVFSCSYDNEEDSYFKSTEIDSPEYAKFSLEGNLNDVSGNNVGLTAYGNPKYSKGINDDENSALLLDGIDDYIVLQLDQLDSITVSLWFKSEVVYASDMSAYKPTLVDYGNHELYAHIDAYTYATVVYAEADGEQLRNDEKIIDSKAYWQHLCIMAGGNNKAKLFLNGEEIDKLETGVQFSPANGKLFIGRASQADNLTLTYYNGLIDEVRIYDYFLTKSEVLGLAKKSTYD